MMKKTKMRGELRSMSEGELKTKLQSLRRERLNLVINAATAHVKDCSQFKKLRKNIAQVLTYLSQAQNNKKAGDKK